MNIYNIIVIAYFLTLLDTICGCESLLGAACISGISGAYQCEIYFACVTNSGCTAEELTIPDIATCREIEMCQQSQISAADDCKHIASNHCSDYLSCLNNAGCAPFTAWAYGSHCPSGATRFCNTEHSESAAYCITLARILSGSCSAYNQCVRTSNCEILASSVLMPSECRISRPVDTRQTLPPAPATSSTSRSISASPPTIYPSTTTGSSSDGAGVGEIIAPTPSNETDESGKSGPDEAVTEDDIGDDADETDEMLDQGIDAETPFKYYAIYGGIGAAVVLIIGVVTICVVRFWRRKDPQEPSHGTSSAIPPPPPHSVDPGNEGTPAHSTYLTPTRFVNEEYMYPQASNSITDPEDHVYMSIDESPPNPEYDSVKPLHS